MDKIEKINELLKSSYVTSLIERYTDDDYLESTKADEDDVYHMAELLESIRALVKS
jgi:hypothetical protein